MKRERAGRPRKRGSPRSVARRPVGRNRIEPLLLVSDRFGRSCAETRIDAPGSGPAGSSVCDNGKPGAGLDPGPARRLRCLTAKYQQVISSVENLDRGQLGGTGLVEGVCLRTGK